MTRELSHADVAAATVCVMALITILIALIMKRAARIAVERAEMDGWEAGWARGHAEGYRDRKTDEQLIKEGLMRETDGPSVRGSGIG